MVLGEDAAGPVEEGLVLMAARGVAMLTTEMGSRPNLLEVIPKQWLYLHTCPLICIFF